MQAFGLVIKDICSNNFIPDFALAKTNLSNSERLINADSWDLLAIEGACYSCY